MLKYIFITLLSIYCKPSENKILKISKELENVISITDKLYNYMDLKEKYNNYYKAKKLDKKTSVSELKGLVELYNIYNGIFFHIFYLNKSLKEVKMGFNPEGNKYLNLNVKNLISESNKLKLLFDKNSIPEDKNIDVYTDFIKQIKNVLYKLIGFFKQYQNDLN